MVGLRQRDDWNIPGFDTEFFVFLRDPPDEFAFLAKAFGFGALMFHGIRWSIEVAEILLLATAVFAVADLADLLRSQFFLFAAFFSASHEATERFDFTDNGGEVELVNLPSNLVGVFVSNRRFAEIGFAVEPSDVDVPGVMFDEMASVIGSAVFFEQGSAGVISPGTVGGKGVELFVVVSEEFVFPNFFVKNGVIDQVIVMTTSGSETGCRSERIQLIRDRSPGFVKGGEYRATDIGRMSGGNDGVLHRDHAPDRDVGGGRTGGAGIGHDCSTGDHGIAQNLGHLFTNPAQVFLFIPGDGLNGFAEGAGSFPPGESGRGIAKLPSEDFEKVFPMDDAPGLQFGDHGKHVVDLRPGAIAGLEEVFGIHDLGRK